MNKIVTNYKKSLRRADRLIDVYQLYLSGRGSRRRGRHHNWAKDILRGAIVIAFAALDVLVHDIVTNEVRRLLKKRLPLSDKLKELLKEKIDTTKWLEIVHQDRPIAHVGSTVDRYLRFSALQNPKDIEENLELVGIHQKSFWETMSLNLKVKSIDEAKGYIKDDLFRRHRIAHAGDIYRSHYRHNKQYSITDKYVGDCIKRLETFGDAFVLSVGKLKTKKRHGKKKRRL